METDVSLLNLSFNFTGLTQSNQRVSLSTINFEKKTAKTCQDAVKTVLQLSRYRTRVHKAGRLSSPFKMK